ncbi:MAG: hypothetical protein CMN87_18225 [Stappia sp.]|uniref:hypothetical protein n=1 Tax=Stappia sp. TaxID=1870903 RepID=UPI000C3CBADE|nr:hypothetical protein [Stappia sp.]MAA97410.1 hypothetical protein [Stappia sp.]MBM21943.1 hypothetical protein [Stappia sp.]|tara:strand:+ start:1971 stop:2918 length:948 start_codon:yes stop_codon:yes gene_type:complete
MFVWWLHEMILRSPEDGGAGGGAPDTGAGGADDGGDPDGGAAAQDGGESTGADAGASDTPPPGEDTGGTGEAYRPDGLAEHLLGANDRETIDKMASALAGYRKRDGERGVPESAAQYAAFGEDVPEELQGHISALSQDTAFQKISEQALERGIPVKDFQAMTMSLYSVAQDMGVLEPPLDADAERAALTPENAKHLTPKEQATARNQRMESNFAFMDLLAQRAGENGPGKDVFDYVKTELGDSAKGHRFMEWVRSQLGGDASNEPTAGGTSASGEDRREALAKRAALPENTPGNTKFDRASYEKLQEDYRKIVGD